MMGRTNYLTRDDLTSSEICILEYCAEGLTNKEIGDKLFISEQTVKFHKTNLYRKLGSRNMMEAVVTGILKGLIDCPCSKNRSSRSRRRRSSLRKST